MEKLNLIVQWLQKNMKIINDTPAVRILIHMKHGNVTGEITILPDSK